MESAQQNIISSCELEKICKFTYTNRGKRNEKCNRECNEYDRGKGRMIFAIAAVYLLGQGPVEQSSTNKPLAMRVVEDALAYSKKPPVIKCRFANRI